MGYVEDTINDITHIQGLNKLIEEIIADGCENQILPLYLEWYKKYNKIIKLVYG